MELLGGRYRIVSLLGAGGMGEVFLAHDTLLERRVAVKLLPADIQSDSVARERLRREALAAAALDHPFICKIHEIGHADGRLFVVMEFVEGETLHVLARRALLPMRQVVEMANELAEALEEAHRRGFVHRDLKPANVMITLQGHVKVMDFGLAKPFAPDASAGVGSDAATMLTASGVRVGTPAYMSPEQILGGALDPRSDIFSLGVILHEVATGRHPFLRDDPAQTMAAILRDPPASGSRDVESLSGFGAVVGRMLAKACAERYQTARELRTELEALRDLAWASTSSRAVASASARQAERTPLVGRETETGELKRLLARMLTGQGGFALVGGEPGVGKTRLARELMEQARQRGCLCLTGRCYEMEGAPPFVPFIEMTEQAVHIVPQAVREAMGDIAPEISTIVPSLRRTYSDIAPVPEVPPEQRRRLVFSAYVEYMQRASQKSPMVVLFDDLHWADEPTLQLLQHVAPHLASMRLLVVGTYRDVELDVKRPFAKTLEELFRQRLATRISLRRLSESGVQQMLSAMSGSAPPSGLAKAVFRETEGNPFFVEEVYQHLAEEGKLFDDSGAWKADLRVDTIEVPEGVRLVIGRRLERLGEHARKVLTAAGVIGRTFPIDVLQAIVDVSEDEVLDALDEAERAQLVASEPGHRTPRYEFVHELIRTTLASGLSIPRRQRLHLKIADALERLRTASLESHASVLAHHLYQAGAAADVQRTARFLMLAGRRAIAAGAFEETLETFDRLIGLELADNEPLLAEAFEHRGAALVGLRRPDEAVAALDRALKLHTARGDDAGIARAAKACHFCFVLLTRLSEMTAVLNRGLHALSDRAVAERAGLQAMLGVCFLLTGFDEAERNLEEAMATAERLADPALIGHVLMFKAVVQDNSLDLGAALDTGRRALPLLRSEALWERSDLVFHLAAAAYRLGRFEELDTLLPLLKETAGRAGHLGALWNHEHFLHRRELMLTGDLRAFLPYAERALRGTAQFLPYIGGARWSPAVMRLYLGQAEEALEQLTALVFDQPIVQAKSLAQTVLFAATALADRADRARTLFPEGVSWLPALGRRNLSSVWVALEASVTGLALVGDKERCGALYPSTLAYIDTGLVCGSEVVGPGNPQLAAALAADAAGHADQARGHFEIALRQARELPFRILQPTVLYWYGRALSSAPDAGDQARGRAMVEAALTDFRGLEMVLHANLAERFLRS